MPDVQLRKLADVEAEGEIELGRGEVISTTALRTWPGDYPVYSSSAAAEGEFGRYGKYMFDEELITWSIDGGGRPFYRTRHKFSVTNVSGYLRIKRKDKWNYRYLHALLTKLQAGIQFDYQMKAHPSVVRELYRLRWIPIAEQQAIAQILDTLDTQIRQTDALIAKLERIKQGLLSDLLTRGIDENGQLRPPPEEAPHLYKDSPLGLIPREWMESTVGNEFEIQLGKMLDAEKNVGELKPYLGNKSVQWERIDLSELGEIRLTASDKERFRLKRGDLLVCEGGEVGRAAIWEDQIEECYYQKALHRLRPKRGFRTELMPQLLRYWTQRDMLAIYTSQTSIAHLSKEKLELVPLVVPPPNEQASIVATLHSHQHRERLEHEQLDALRSLKSGLMDDLLTGRVRVMPLLDTAKEAYG